MQAIQHPDITRMERHGMPEATITGVCKGCGESITDGEDYYEDGNNEDILLHDDSLCIAKYYRKNVLILR